MSRHRKSKVGMTLIEMILVVAIIIILAAVLVLNVTEIIRNSREKSEELDRRAQEYKQNVRDRENELVGYNFGKTNFS